MAIKAVIEKNPKKPAEVRGMSPAKIKHERDRETMDWLMSAIHLPTMDELIDELPHRIRDRALWFWEHARGIHDNSLFYLYDPVLDEAVEELFTAWNEALSHGEQYDMGKGESYVFSSPMDMPLRPKRQKVWDQIDLARRELRQALDDVLDRLRDGYIEINPRDTNTKAWRSYVDFRKDLERNLNHKSQVKSGSKRRLKRPRIKKNA